MKALELAVFLDEMADTADGGRPKMKDDVRRMAAAELRRLAAVEAERDALKAENERLTNCLKKANDQAEDFERRWYLADMELERIKALPPVAWRTFDGEGGYDYRTYDMNESYAEDYAKRNPNHAHWVEPLYALGSKT